MDELETAQSAQEAELKEVKTKADCYEDKSMSIKLFTTVKVRVEMVKDYKEGMMSTWDLEVAYSTWEKMKLLYSDSEGNEDQEVVEQVSQGRPNKVGEGASRYGGVTKEVSVG